LFFFFFFGTIVYCVIRHTRQRYHAGYKETMTALLGGYTGDGSHGHATDDSQLISRLV
jgi:hypothetical protein